MSNKHKGNTFSKKFPRRKMNIAKILNKPIIILSNKYIIEINELRKIGIDISDAIAYVLSAKIKNSGFRGKKEKMNE